MTARFAKGCHLDKGKHRYTPFAVARMRGLVSLPTPASVDLSAFQPPMMDQGQTGSCEGHSSAAATDTTLAKSGNKLPWVPSPAGIYTLARCVDRSSPSQKLTDGGTETNAVIRAISEFGIRPMGKLASDGRYSDCEVTSINDEPELGDLEKDSLTLVIGAYQITSTGAQKFEDYKAALANGFAVRVDSFVDTAFEEWTKGSAPYGVPNTNDPDGGGHALYSAGYSSGHGVITNSWGKTWGDAGHIVVTPAWIEQADVFCWKVQVSK